METNNQRKEIFSKKINAGRRTYFFDVIKMKLSDELYITITEKKKSESESERFKIFLYKEEFDNFLESLTEVIQYAKTNEKKAE